MYKKYLKLLTGVVACGLCMAIATPVKAVSVESIDQMIRSTGTYREEMDESAVEPSESQVQQAVSANELDDDGDLQTEGYNPCTVDAFTLTPTLKGVQGSGYFDHYFMNCYLDTGFAPDGASYATRYEYKGNVYYFTVPAGISETTVRACNRTGKTVSITFLLRYVSGKEYMIWPGAREYGYNYYAPNFSDAAVALKYEAFFHFLAEKFSQEDCHIDNWILGNEENMPAIGKYHATSSYYASLDADTIVSRYAMYYNCVYDAVRTYTNATRVSISVDHSWNHNDEGRGITTRQFLDLFNAKVGSGKDWAVSYHAYPAILFESKIWAPHSDFTGTKLNPNSIDASFVDGANLHILTDYIKSHYGGNHRVMLTEVGFSQYQGLNEQAASFAYTYYAAKYNDLVDCLILHTAKINDRENYEFGSVAEEVFNKIDDGSAADAAWIDSVCLPVIGVRSWSEIIPGYKPAKNVNKEQVQAFVNRLYNGCLGREADSSGLTNWTNRLIRGTASGASAAQGFFFSAEMNNRNLSDEDFVETLYNVMMGRASDAGGKSDWLYKLKNGVTREGVFKGFSDSTEFDNICNSYGIERGSIAVGQARDANPGLTTFVSRLYTKALERDYEDAGLNYWCEKINSRKWSINDVSTTGFFNSPEFMNKNTSNDQYVTILYHTFFDREPDQAGYNDWMGRLSRGVSRNEVLQGFANSPEFANLKKSFGL